jgi:predicted nucleotidyltransferase
VGSVLRPGEFRPDSDIDLIVWGLPRAALISAWVDAEKRSAFPIDLIAWERATPRLRRAFHSEGKVVFGAGAI